MVIFLAANFAQGRSIRPQLRFHFAGDIPVYASSRIFSGKPNQAADQDLNGVRFPVTPYQLSIDSSNTLPPLTSLRGGSFAALYALGRDAWHLLPWLGLMRDDAEFRMQGDAGYYRSDQAGKLQREPAFAIFSGGRPEAIIPATNRGGQSLMHKRALGDRWERCAESFLHDHGLKTIKRNFQCRYGEIDLIMEDGDCLVFTEVRYRNKPYYGSGADTVTKTKQGRIIRTLRNDISSPVDTCP